MPFELNFGTVYVVMLCASTSVRRWIRIKRLDPEAPFLADIILCVLTKEIYIPVFGQVVSVSFTIIFKVQLSEFHSFFK